jgi:lysophospholipase L1-like esterase
MSKALVGIDTGVVTFTPGAAGIGRLVFAGITGFNPSRLLAVTNITRKLIIYVAEGGAGQAGTWSSVTATGGTLTLDIVTSSHNASDALRCVYEGGGSFDLQPRGGNGVGVPVDEWALSAQTTRVTDYGHGPLPGTRSCLLTFNMVPDNTGLSLQVPISGRTDGARYVFSVYIKGANQLISTSMVAYNSAGTHYSVAYGGITGSAGWQRVTAVMDCNIASAAYVRLQIRGQAGVTATVEVACADVRAIEDGVPLTYAEPSGTSLIYMLPLRRSSVACWGDSLTAGVGGFEFRTELARLLQGSTVFNGGVGGETSSQVLARFQADASRVNEWGVVVLWAGRNDLGTPATVLANIDTMVAGLTHGRYLVVGVTNQTTEPIGHYSHKMIGIINAGLATKYGARFVDVRSLLCSGTADDSANPNYHVDAIHPNAAGHGMIAMAIYQAIIRNGYAPSVASVPPQALSPATVTESFTRPANTTAYTIGDLVANDATAGSVVPIVLPIYHNRIIRRLRLFKSTTTVTAATFRLHMFGSAPTVASGDNSAISMTGGPSYLGKVDIASMQAFTDGCAAAADVGVLGASGRMPSFGGLYVLIEALGAYAPGNGEVFAVTAETDP